MGPRIEGLDLVAEKYLDEVIAAAPRARAAGAREPLRFLGMGMTAVVFGDGSGLAYKVARKGAGEMLATEADWFRLASQIPAAARHIARFVRYDARHNVIVREAVHGGRARESTSFAIHKHLDKVLRPYGYGAPEYKAESYVVVRGRGPILFDASMPLLFGRALVRRALDMAAGRIVPREPRDFRDTAWAVKMERGGTIPTRVADEVLVRLGCAHKEAFDYLMEDSETRPLGERARHCK